MTIKMSEEDEWKQRFNQDWRRIKIRSQSKQLLLSSTETIVLGVCTVIASIKGEIDVAMVCAINAFLFAIFLAIDLHKLYKKLREV